MLGEFRWSSCEAQVAVTPLQTEGAVRYYRITVEYPEKRTPETIRLWWHTTFNDMFASWTPLGRFTHHLMPSWMPVGTDSRTAFGAPVFAVMSKGGENRCTFALADAATPVRLTAGMDEATGEMECVVQLFTSRVDELTHYETVLRVDETPYPYYEALYRVRHWWVQKGYAAAPVPEDACRTMYSSWYSFQKDITEATVLEECRYAKAMGMDTVILDDGWQCDETVNGYAYCGDWEPVPSKFPDMRRFVDRLHEMGMKALLWYSVPFMGQYAQNYERFQGRYLRKYAYGPVMVLDPRYEDVRAYLVGIYETALREWDLDGFKLDFIDEFRLTDDAAPACEAMDQPSLEAAVEMLLCDIVTALRRVKPSVMIEFRQCYVGPVVQKYGNILRVSDCSSAALYNRVSSLDLRLLTGDPTLHPTSAVHSDMLLWDYTATPEGVADQLAACLFCVPQISVRLERLPEPHRQVLATYMDFIDRYRDVLLRGKLRPLCPDANYTQVVAETGSTAIAALYSDPLFELPPAPQAILINATGRRTVYVKNTDAPRPVRFAIKNCMGEVLQEGEQALPVGVTEFAVPHNGFLYLE